MGKYGGDDKPNNIPSGDQNNIPNGNSSHEQPDTRNYITKADIEQAARQVYEKCKWGCITSSNLTAMRLAKDKTTLDYNGNLTDLKRLQIKNSTDCRSYDPLSPQ